MIFNSVQSFPRFLRNYCPLFSLYQYFNERQSNDMTVVKVQWLTLEAFEEKLKPSSSYLVKPAVTITKRLESLTPTASTVPLERNYRLLVDKFRKTGNINDKTQSERPCVDEDRQVGLWDIFLSNPWTSTASVADECDVLTSDGKIAKKNYLILIDCTYFKN